MPDRTTTAQILLGFFAALTCALLGIFESLMFRGSAIVGIVIFTLIPLVGALKSRQRILTVGLLAGSIVSLIAYFALRPR